MIIFTRFAMGAITALICISNAGSIASANAEPISQALDDTLHPLNSSALDLELQHQRQNLQVGDGQLTTLLLAPSVNSLRGSHHSWSLGVDIPLQQVEGTYAYNIPLNVADACERLDAGQVNPERGFLIRRLTQLCADYQDEDYQASGIGDISIYAQYAYYNESNWTPATSISYKFDNADYDEFLGSGTKEVHLSASILGSFHNLATSLYVGHTVFSGGDLETLYDDYSQAEVTLRTPWRLKWELGTTFGHRNPNDVDVTHASLFGGLRLGKNSSLVIEYTSYQGDNYSIDSEITASANVYF
ncbi:hypothetical protein [Aurantivibrio plasticivorans]